MNGCFWDSLRLKELLAAAAAPAFRDSFYAVFVGSCGSSSSEISRDANAIAEALFAGTSRYQLA